MSLSLSNVLIYKDVSLEGTLNRYRRYSYRYHTVLGLTEWLMYQSTIPGYRYISLGSIPGSTRFFSEVMGLERGPLGLVSTTVEILERNISGSGPESPEYVRRDPSR
jgi:hypothetical protein